MIFAWALFQVYPFIILKIYLWPVHTLTLVVLFFNNGALLNTTLKEYFTALSGLATNSNILASNVSWNMKLNTFSTAANNLGLSYFGFINLNGKATAFNSEKLK